MTITEMNRSVLEPRDCAYDATKRGPRQPQHPFRTAMAISLVGYAVLTVVLLVIGFLLTHPLSTSIGGWDEHVNEYFARHRTSGWNEITKIATAGFNTLAVILAASSVVAFLGLRRRWHEAAFLTLALFIEITVFLSVTFIVARPRPAVVRLNSTPSTSSFPSGHTAAATVLFTGIAIIVFCCTTHLWARALSTLLAAAVTLTVGFARVYRGLHHPTDVFMGAVLGLSCLFVSARTVRAWSRARQAPAQPEDAIQADRAAAGGSRSISVAVTS
jgi:membrane-associated phospholipid phosphatase